MQKLSKYFTRFLHLFKVDEGARERNGLLCRRIIYVENHEDPKSKNKITLKLARQLVQDIEKLNFESEKPIYFILESDGGEFNAGLMVREAILNSKSKIIGVAIGDVMSAASHIYEACHERWIIDGAHIFLHPMWVDAQFTFRITPEIKLENVTSRVSEFVAAERNKMRVLQRQVYSDYANRIGSKMTSIQIKRIFLAKRALTANSAIEMYLADKKIKEFNFDKPEKSV